MKTSNNYPFVSKIKQKTNEMLEKLNQKIMLKRWNDQIFSFSWIETSADRIQNVWKEIISLLADEHSHVSHCDIDYDDNWILMAGVFILQWFYQTKKISVSTIEWQDGSHTFSRKAKARKTTRTYDCYAQ